MTNEDKQQFAEALAERYIQLQQIEGSEDFQLLEQAIKGLPSDIRMKVEDMIYSTQNCAKC